MLKPPRYGNCTIPENQEMTAEFENFKIIFKGGCEKQFQKMKNKITSGQLLLLDTNDVFHEEYEEIFENMYIAEISENVIYYLSGFITKKVFNLSKCTVCREQLYSTIPNLAPESELNSKTELTSLKSRGWLNHPEFQIFKLLLEVERVLFKHINMVDVFELNIDELFDNHFQEVYFGFSCSDHKLDVFCRIIYYYIVMRIKQFYRQEQHKATKACANNRKQSRLQAT